MKSIISQLFIEWADLTLFVKINLHGYIIRMSGCNDSERHWSVAHLKNCT